MSLDCRESILDDFTLQDTLRNSRGSPDSRKNSTGRKREDLAYRREKLQAKRMGPGGTRGGW